MDIAIWVAIIGISGTLAAQGMAWLRGHFADKARREHEQKMKQIELNHAEQIKKMEQEEARQQRLREARMQAYTALARASSTVDPNEEYRLTDLAEGFADIELVGGSEQVVRHALNLSDWCGELRKRARNAKQEDRALAEDEDVQEALAYLRHERKNFLEAAREDIGHPPNTTNT